LYSKAWHESQRIQKLIDGGIEISFRVAGLDEIRQWVLSFGSEAVVVEPAEFKISVWKSLKDIPQLRSDCDAVTSRLNRAVEDMVRLVNGNRVVRVRIFTKP